MPRPCLACHHPRRKAIDEALLSGESFRDVAKRSGISPAGLFRHKVHIETPTSTPSSDGVDVTGSKRLMPTQAITENTSARNEPERQQLTEISDGNSDSRARSLANLKPFKPGQSGNPGGRPKGIVRRALLRQFRTEVAAGVKRGDVMADAVMTKAESGDLATATFLRDTIDGLPTRKDNGDSTNVGIAIRVEHIGAKD